MGGDLAETGSYMLAGRGTDVGRDRVVPGADRRRDPSSQM